LRYGNTGNLDIGGDFYIYSIYTDNNIEEVSKSEEA
jgi:hypothetical protein